MTVLCDREDDGCPENAQKIIFDSGTSGKDSARISVDAGVSDARVELDWRAPWQGWSGLLALLPDQASGGGCDSPGGGAWSDGWVSSERSCGGGSAGAEPEGGGGG